MNTKNRIEGHALAVFTTLVWGTTFVSTKVLLQDFSAYEIIVFRLIPAYLIFMLVCPKFLPFEGWKQEFLYCMAALTGVVLYQVLENLALTQAYASTTGVVISAAPMFTAIFTWIWLKEESPDWKFFLGFVVAMAGVYLVSLNSGEAGFSIYGTILALGAAALWGIYSIICKGINEGRNALQVTRRIFFYAALMMIPTYLITGCRFEISDFMKPVNTLNMLYLGIVASAACFLIWNVTVKKIGIISTGLYIYSIPVVTVIFSAIILKEKITWMTFAGMALALGGLVLSANRGGTKHG